MLPSVQGIIVIPGFVLFVCGRHNVKMVFMKMMQSKVGKVRKSGKGF